MQGRRAIRSELCSVHDGIVELEDIAEGHVEGQSNGLRVIDRDSQGTKSELVNPVTSFAANCVRIVDKVVVADEPGYSSTEIRRYP